jgi:hypothetical protein
MLKTLRLVRIDAFINMTDYIKAEKLQKKSYLFYLFLFLFCSHIFQFAFILYSKREKQLNDEFNFWFLQYNPRLLLLVQKKSTIYQCYICCFPSPRRYPLNRKLLIRIFPESIFSKKISI